MLRTRSLVGAPKGIAMVGVARGRSACTVWGGARRESEWRCLLGFSDSALRLVIWVSGQAKSIIPVWYCIILPKGEYNSTGCVLLLAVYYCAATCVGAACTSSTELTWSRTCGRMQFSCTCTQAHAGIRFFLLMAFLSLYADYMRMLSCTAHARRWQFVSDTGEPN